MTDKTELCNSIRERLIALVKEAEENKVIIKVDYEKLEGAGYPVSVKDWRKVTLICPIPDEIKKQAEIMSRVEVGKVVRRENDFLGRTAGVVISMTPFIVVSKDAKERTVLPSGDDKDFVVIRLADKELLESCMTRLTE